MRCFGHFPEADRAPIRSPLERDLAAGFASGGAGKVDHMVDVLRDGKADAVLAASIFHFGEYTVGDVKRFLGEHGVPVRL